MGLLRWGRCSRFTKLSCCLVLDSLARRVPHRKGLYEPQHGSLKPPAKGLGLYHIYHFVNTVSIHSRKQISSTFYFCRLRCAVVTASTCLESHIHQAKPRAGMLSPVLSSLFMTRWHQITTSTGQPTSRMHPYSFWESECLLGNRIQRSPWPVEAWAPPSNVASMTAVRPSCVDT